MEPSGWKFPFGPTGGLVLTRLLHFNPTSHIHKGSVAQRFPSFIGTTQRFRSGVPTQMCSLSGRHEVPSTLQWGQDGLRATEAVGTTISSAMKTLRECWGNDRFTVENESSVLAALGFLEDLGRGGYGLWVDGSWLDASIYSISFPSGKSQQKSFWPCKQPVCWSCWCLQHFNNENVVSLSHREHYWETQFNWYISLYQKRTAPFVAICQPIL